MKKLLICFCALFLLNCTEVPDYGTLKASASPTYGGSIKKSPSGPEYKDGTVVTLTAEAEPGYEFANWSGNVTAAESPRTTITIDGDDMVIANFTKKPDKLNTPTDIEATVSNGSINIDWSSVSGATGYRIYRSTSYSGGYTQIGTSTTNLYTDTYNLSPGTIYYYKVTAYSNDVESSQSGYASAEVPVVLNVPANVKATTSSTSGITIDWSSVSGATGYRIYRSETPSDDYIQIGTSSTNSYTDNGLTSGTTYYYKVTSYYSGKESSQSSYAYATTYSINAPTNVKAVADKDYCIITITWSPVPNATEYRIYRSTSSSGEYIYLSYAYYDESSYEDWEFEESSVNKTFYYKVGAYNEDTDEERLSNSANAKYVCSY